LPSNTALAVGRDIEYVLIKTFNQYTFEPINIILARPLLEKQFGKKFVEGTDEDFANYTAESKTIPYQVLAEITGEDLAGTTYEQLIPWFLPAENPEKAFRVIIGDFVTTEDGTGIVHIAPTFGADDNRVAQENGIPPMLVKDENDNLVPLVDLTGRFLKGERLVVDVGTHDQVCNTHDVSPKIKAPRRGPGFCYARPFLAMYFCSLASAARPRRPTMSRFISLSGTPSRYEAFMASSIAARRSVLRRSHSSTARASRFASQAFWRKMRA
jgi:hypothetical protein